MTTDVDLPLPGGGSMVGALALPTRPGPHPAVVVIHEIMGINRDMREKVDRFAAEGYAALAPDLYSRGRKPLCIAKALRELTSRRAGQANADIETARRWLAARDDVDAGRTAVVGFCLGGGFALIHAAAAPEGLSAAGVFYGDVPKDPATLDGVCPVVASYGGRDRTLRGAAARLEKHLIDKGVPHDVKEYPDAGHSFLSPGSEKLAFGLVAKGPMKVGFNQAAADDSWRRLLAFFREHV